MLGLRTLGATAVVALVLFTNPGSAIMAAAQAAPDDGAAGSATGRADSPVNTQPKDGALVVLSGGSQDAGFPLAVFPPSILPKDCLLCAGDIGEVPVSNPPFVNTRDVSATATGEAKSVQFWSAAPGAAAWIALAEPVYEVVSSEPEEDRDGNGLPDQLFHALSRDNAYWFSSAEGMTAGVYRWDGSAAPGAGDGLARVVLEAPTGPAAWVVAEVPRSVVRDGESAALVLLVSVAPPRAFDGLDRGVSSGPYVAVGLVVTADVGQTVYEPLGLETEDLSLKVTAYMTDAGAMPEAQRVPATLLEDPERVGFAPFRQAWTHVQGVATNGACTFELRGNAFLALGGQAMDEAGENESESPNESSSAIGADLAPSTTGGEAATDNGEELTALLQSLAEDMRTKSLLSVAWVDFNYLGSVENGTESEPFRLLAGGLNAVAQEGTVRLKGDVTLPWSSETPRITQAVRLEAVGGGVRIGDPAALPAVDFTASPRSGPAPLTVNFTNTSVRGGVPWAQLLWDFGDGAPLSTGNAVSYTYGEEGSYTVSLTAATSMDGATETKADYIAVYPASCMLQVTVGGTGGAMVTGGGLYVGGAEAQLTAAMSHEYSPGQFEYFTGWSGDVTSIENPLTVLMDGNKSVVAGYVADVPDLAIDAVSTPPPSEAKSDGTFAVAWTVVNNLSDTALDWTDAVLLSEDAEASPDDLVLQSFAHTGGLNNGGSYGAGGTVTVPDVAPGRYWVLLQLDQGGALTERAQDSNTHATEITILDKEMTNE